MKSGENISPAGCEASARAARVLAAGTRMDYATSGVLASVGALQVNVYAQADGQHHRDRRRIGRRRMSSRRSYQIRNSNSYSLAAQVQRAGGAITLRPCARDTEDDVAQRAWIAAFESDLMLLTGGVSAGKYDLVEDVLAEYDAEFHFTRVLIQPGQPAVFGRARGQILFRSARQPGIHDGDVRVVCAARDRTC